MGGFVFSLAKNTLYFAGDSGLGDGQEFSLIKDKFKNIDVAILPIGAYKPQSFMNQSHMTPEQAVKAHLIIKPTKSIAMEYDVFPMADEDYGEALLDLAKAKKKYKIPKHEFITLENGKHLLY